MGKEPERILTELEEKVKTRVMEIALTKDTVRRGIYHVTDFAQSCPRKSFYSHLKGAAPVEESVPRRYKMMCALLLGSAVHGVMENRAKIAFPEGHYELEMAYDVEADVNVDVDTVDEMPFEQMLNVCVGTLDALYKIDGEWILVDYKTRNARGFAPPAPMPDHKSQVNIYHAMLEALSRVSGIEMPTKGMVVYLDTSKQLSNIWPFEIDFDPVEAVKQRMVERLNILRDGLTGALPERHIIDWMCGKNGKPGFCPYRSRCFSEEIISMEKHPLVAGNNG